MAMFSQEVNGYNRAEVDAFIEQMKSNYESRLMEEKLKTLESEKRVLDMINHRTEIENKERNIMTALNAIEKAKKFQEEGSKNLYKLVMDKLDILVRELNSSFPMLKRDQNFADILNEFCSILEKYQMTDGSNDINRPIFSDNDSMRVLLGKMQGYKSAPKDAVKEPTKDTAKDAQKPEPKEVHITLTRKKLEDISPNESGFSFKEALNPTEELSEIMKAFDFYHGN